jgi:hypothetical protein
MRKIALIVIAAAGLVGCSTYQVPKYAVSVQNADAFRALGGAKITVASFTGGEEAAKTEFKCRLVGPIQTPTGETYAAYVQQALTDELKVAGLYAEDAKIKVQGNLSHIDLSSAIGGGHWDLTLVVTVGGEPSFTVTRSYTFESSFVAEKACALSSQAFLGAVQDLMNALAKDPAFVKLVAAGKV